MPCHLQNVLLTRSYHSADCYTDHSFVCSKIRLQPKKLHRSKSPGKPRINTNCTRSLEMSEKFCRSIRDALHSDTPEGDAQQRWSHLRNTIHDIAFSVFGKKTRKSPDWVEANSTVLTALTEKRCAAALDYKQNPSQASLQTLMSARNEVQRTARRCANDFWLQLGESNRHAADTGNTAGVYDGTKKAIGPTVSKIAPLKTTTGVTITGRAKQMAMGGALL